MFCCNWYNFFFISVPLGSVWKQHSTKRTTVIVHVSLYAYTIPTSSFACQTYFQLGVNVAWRAKILYPYGHPGSNYDTDQSEDLNIYRKLKFMPKMFPFFPITFFAPPLVLNSWNKVQFCDKISTLTFCSPLWRLCVLNSILTRSKRTQGLVFEIRTWASALLVLLYFVSYLIRSPYFTPSLRFIPSWRFILTSSVIVISTLTLKLLVTTLNVPELLTSFLT